VHLTQKVTTFVALCSLKVMYIIQIQATLVINDSDEVRWSSIQWYDVNLPYVHLCSTTTINNEVKTGMRVRSDSFPGREGL